VFAVYVRNSVIVKLIKNQKIHISYSQAVTSCLEVVLINNFDSC